MAASTTNHFERLLAELTIAEVPLPPPIQRFVDREPQPLALDTRARLPEWCAEHGYSEAQQRILRELIGLLAGRDAYLEAVAAGGPRFDLDGQDGGPVAEAERVGASRRLAERRVKRQARALGSALNARPLPSSSSSSSTGAASPASISAALTNLSLALGPNRSALPAATGRAPVVEVRAKRRLRAFAQSPAPAPVRASGAHSTTPARSPAPAFVPRLFVREAVQRVATRRGSLQVIAAFTKAGHVEAAEDERLALLADCVRVMINDGYAEDAVKAQLANAVDDLLTGVVPRQGRR